MFHSKFATNEEGLLFVYLFLIELTKDFGCLSSEKKKNDDPFLTTFIFNDRLHRLWVRDWVLSLQNNKRETQEHITFTYLYVWIWDWVLPRHVCLYLHVCLNTSHRGYAGQIHGKKKRKRNNPSNFTHSSVKNSRNIQNM